MVLSSSITSIVSSFTFHVLHRHFYRKSRPTGAVVEGRDSSALGLHNGLADGEPQAHPPLAIAVLIRGGKEIVKYLEGEYTLEEAIEIIKRDSRRYAKRQITWFKRYKESKWFDLGKYNNMEMLKEDILNFIENISKNV